MLIRQSLSYLPAQIAGPICQFLAVIAWTHYLAPDELGDYNLAVSLQELFYYSLFSWWGFYTLRSIGQRQAAGDSARFAGTENSVLLALLAVECALAAVLLYTLVDAHAPPRLAAAFLVYALTRSVLLYLGERARATHDIAAYTVIQLVPSVIGLALGLLLVELLGGAAEWPLAGLAAAQTMALGYAVVRLGIFRGSYRIDRDVLRQGLAYGLPLMAGGLVYWVSMHANRFIVDYFLGRAEVAQFSVAMGLADRSLTFVALLLAPAVFPLAVKAMETEGQAAAMARMREGTSLGLVLTIPAIAGAAALAGPIARLMLGAEYEASVASLLPLAAVAAGLSVWTIPGQVFMLNDRSDLSMKFSALDAGLGLILAVLLIPRLGIEGAMIARILGTAIALGAGLGLAQERYGYRLPLAEASAFLAASAVMVLVLRLALPPPESGFGLALHIAAGAGVYAVTLAALMRQRLRAWWPGILSHARSLGLVR